MSNQQINRQVARKNFEKARRKAKMAELTSRITGKEDRLLPFDVIRAELRLQNPLYKGVVMIPLEGIVGSIGRYKDFTREYLPLNDSMRERWIGVESLAMSQQGWPPIEVYKVGDIYFVKDGNHRTAIARKMGNTVIEAHVWEYPEALQIDSKDELDDVLIQLGEKEFMETTHLSQLIPEHTILFTTPGRYQELTAQIENLRQTLSDIDSETVEFEDAVPLWYEMIYRPTVQIIRESTLLDDFEGRTESDLFAWLSTHRTILADRYGDYANLADLAQMLADRYKESNLTKVTRQMRNLLGGDELPPLED